MRQKFSLLIVLISAVMLANALPYKNDFYQIKIYHVKNNEQVSMVDDYLKNAYLPALHRAGIKNIGVFKPIANDTATEKLIYVFIPFASEAVWTNIEDKLNKDAVYLNSSKVFIQAPFDKAPYERMESILMEAFPGQAHLVVPPAKNAERVFELRSYESPTENLHKKKMAMFNTGGEIPLFDRLGFNPVFYGRVISGSRMPNFMYMPIFAGVEERNAQWKKFGADAEWKRISAIPENENSVSVSRIDSIIMRATDYSDY